MNRTLNQSGSVTYFLENKTINGQTNYWENVPRGTIEKINGWFQTHELPFVANLSVSKDRDGINLLFEIDNPVEWDSDYPDGISGTISVSDLNNVVDEMLKDLHLETMVTIDVEDDLTDEASLLEHVFDEMAMEDENEYWEKADRAWERSRDERD